jgi:hypothetical protein
MVGYLVDQKSWFAFTFFCTYEHTRLVGASKLQTLLKFLQVLARCTSIQIVEFFRSFSEI